METELDDRALWDAALAHDGRAFAELFRRHRDRVFRHALRLVETTSDAEDVVASAFLELWRKRAGVTLVGDSIVPWLIVAAGNLARNSRRSARRHRRLLDKLPAPIESQPAPDLDGSRDLLRSLQPRDCALLSLVVLEGYAVKDAATVVGISEGAARTRLHRARRSLRISLESSPFGSRWKDAT